MITVIDDFFAPAHLRDCMAAFPAPDSTIWKTYTAEHEAGKQECDDPTKWPRIIASSLHMLAREIPFMAEYRTAALTASFAGGGMHQSPPGARLDMHTDFNRLPGDGHMVRRVNAIQFCNPNWESGMGGELMLDDVIIAPRNALVLFDTNSRSFHGHAPVLEPFVRRSLAVYFYTPLLPSDAPFQSTHYREG